MGEDDDGHGSTYGDYSYQRGFLGDGLLSSAALDDGGGRWHAHGVKASCAVSALFSPKPSTLSGSLTFATNTWPEDSRPLAPHPRRLRTQGPSP